jgi:hypothetical protein
MSGAQSCLNGWPACRRASLAWRPAVARITGRASSRSWGTTCAPGLCAGAHEVLEDLPRYANLVIGELFSELTHLQERIAQSERQIARDDAQAQQLMRLRGVGQPRPVPSLPASAMGMTFSMAASSAPGLG